jgi:hypothetical protein
VLSLIRLIDTLTHTEARPDAPEEMPPMTYTLKLVIMLKPGAARGRHELRIVPELPSGENLPEFMSKKKKKSLKSWALCQLTLSRIRCILPCVC